MRKLDSESREYLEANRAYWERGYEAPNVENQTFRFLGRILRPDFGLPRNHEKLLDFGCGQGAAVNFFRANGFDAEGVDMSRTDIAVAKSRYPHIKTHFSLCHEDPTLQENDYGSAEKYSVITAFQSLFFLSKDNFNVLMNRLYDQLLPGGIFFATMMGVQSKEFFDNSTPTKDEWLRKVDFTNERLTVENYFMFFTSSEEDLVSKFSMFRPVHLGYYSAKLRGDEGDGFHFTFCGVKDQD